MAQLVKLLDYISRYENDLSRYPTQFIRLKKSQWERMRYLWESGAELSLAPAPEEHPEEERPEEEKWFSPFLRLFGRRTENESDAEAAAAAEPAEEEFDFKPNIIARPRDLDHLRQLYVDQLFHFQMKWASSTMLEKSRVDGKFLRDSLLREMTLKLPDSYLLFYYPILKVKKAPVELDILLLTPLACICITVVEGQDAAAYEGGSDRFWTKRYGEKESKVLNPVLALNRMERIVSGLFAQRGIEFPIRKMIISRNGYIDYPGTPYDIRVIDRRSYREWFNNFAQSTSPMKRDQFKAAQAILDVGQTTAMSRLFESFEQAADDEEKTED